LTDAWKQCVCGSVRRRRRCWPVPVTAVCQRLHRTVVCANLRPSLTYGRRSGLRSCFFLLRFPAFRHRETVVRGDRKNHPYSLAIRPGAAVEADEGESRRRPSLKNRDQPRSRCAGSWSRPKQHGAALLRGPDIEPKSTTSGLTGAVKGPAWVQSPAAALGWAAALGAAAHPAASGHPERSWGALARWSPSPTPAAIRRA